MRREIRIVLKRDKKHRGYAEAWDKFVASIPPYVTINPHDGRPPARLRVQNKEPRRHKKDGLDGCESENSSSSSSSGVGNVCGASNHLHLSKPKLNNCQPNWDRMLEDKAKMIEMHAF